jgi:hypothetical protein
MDNWRDEAARLIVNGKPVAEMTRDELLKAVVTMDRGLKDLQQQFESVSATFAELLKARNKIN